MPRPSGPAQPEARAAATSRALAQLEEQQRLYARWFRPGGLEAFCWEACRTKDEHDTVSPIKPLPDLEFLRLFFRLVQSERVLFVAKSRQVFVSWATFVYMLWRVLAAPHQSIALIPKKQEDGQNHVEDRLKHTLWANLPEWLRARYTIAAIKGGFNVTHRDGEPWGSFVVVYPQGAEQLRSYTHSVIVGDEVAHQRGHQAWWRAAIPTVQERGGKAGQIIQISSARRGSYFEKQLGPKLRDAVALAKATQPAVAA